MRLIIISVLGLISLACFYQFTAQAFLVSFFAANDQELRDVSIDAYLWLTSSIVFFILCAWQILARRKQSKADREV
jgi:glucan phosphoethanolaminetransferase (alkaline phosphatase superfamily)